MFEQQIESFKEEYNLIVWDCPCHGKSRPYEQFSYSNVVADMKKIIDAEGIGEVILVRGYPKTLLKNNDMKITL